jgi:hypothetical protein
MVVGQMLLLLLSVFSVHSYPACFALQQWSDKYVSHECLTSY